MAAHEGPLLQNWADLLKYWNSQTNNRVGCIVMDKFSDFQNGLLIFAL
jgi:hypothetical protein